MKRKAILPIAGIALFLFTTTLCNAQSLLRGKVVDSVGHPLYGASVLLHRSKDSSLVKGSITTQNGTYVFDKIPAGHYFIASSYTGYKDSHSFVFQVDGVGVISITTLKILDKVILKDVTVTGKKPMFEQKIDRMVINVASSITNTGSSVLEVLMRSPGITVNQQNNTLSMNGKDGVMLMLNGKISRLPLNAIVQMLSGMSSSNIERIELITTPPADLDAEGNAGFINIVLKKNTQYGANGSFSATAGYGIDGGPVVSGSITLNQRQEKWNFYGDYSFARVTPGTLFGLNRTIINGGNTIKNIMSTKRNDFRRNHNARIGLDYELDRKTILGVLITGFSNMYGMAAVNNSNIFVNNSLDTTMFIDQFERHPLDNYGTNLNVLHRFQEEEQLSVNFDYIHYRDANNLTYLNKLYGGNGNFISDEQMKSKKETPINFWVASADYSKKLGKKVDMEAGVKATLSHFINDVRVEREAQTNWTIDKDFSSKHNLKESIFAAYTSFDVVLGAKTKAKIGLRYEYTNSNLGSEIKKNIVDRHYGNLFPSLFLSHSLTDKSSFNFSYSRRITRPTFNDMAPFVYFFDPNTFFSGNPALQPSFANAVKFDYLRNRFVFSLSYTHEKNTITNFAPVVDAATNKQTFAAANQKDKNIISLVFSLPFTINKWWTVQNNISGEWQQLNAFYKGTPLTISQPNFRVNSTQSILLPKNYSIEVNGNYQSAGFFGMFKMEPMLSLNFGLQKKLGPKYGTVLFNITDFSGPPHYKLIANAPEHNLVTDIDLRFVVTTFKLTYTINFGNNKVKENRRRTTGAEEERQRVQAN